jgi:anti-anti-sigma regulatory factor
MNFSSNSANSGSTEPAITRTIPPDVFAGAFPFHLVFNRQLTLLQIGTVLQRIYPALLVGQPLDHYFRFRVPEIEPTFDQILEQSRTVFLLEAQDIALQLKGAMMYDQADDLLFYLCSPWLTDSSQLKPLGLSFQDFAIHDPIVDFLLLLQAQQTALADTKKLNDKLRSQREQLRQANQTLAEQYAEQQQLQDQVNQAQAALLAELSTPLIPISEHIVVMPLIGAIDARRSQQVLETLLEGINENQAQVVILDITGVAVVDTHVANGLLQAARAARLLGAEVILTGIRPEVAQAVIGLGVDMRGIVTHSTLQKGIRFAMSRQEL